MVQESHTRIWNELVDDMIAANTLHTSSVIEAFRHFPRSKFVAEDIAGLAAEADSALPIGEGQTVSQPTTVAIMLQAVYPQHGETVLDIGTGSGWQAALLAYLVGTAGHVYTIERVPALARAARQRFQQLGIQNITSLVGDASEGLPEHAPYDVIIAAAEISAIPAVLIEHLAPGGRLLQPIAEMGLRVVTKDRRGHASVRDIPGFVFVPLVQTGEKPKEVAL